MPNHILTVDGLTKVFDTDKGQVLAVDAASFEISSNEFFTMLGPSGCGKTTTLRLIAGLENMSAGRILFDGEDFKAPLKMPSGALNRLESGRRDTGIRGTSDGPNGLF